jgi:predicted DNA binding CopG/RHH family protein
MKQDKAEQMEENISEMDKYWQIMKQDKSEQIGEKTIKTYEEVEKEITLRLYKLGFYAIAPRYTTESKSKELSTIYYRYYCQFLEKFFKDSSLRNEKTVMKYDNHRQTFYYDFVDPNLKL